MSNGDPTDIKSRSLTQPDGRPAETQSRGPTQPDGRPLDIQQRPSRGPHVKADATGRSFGADTGSSWTPKWLGPAQRHAFSSPGAALSGRRAPGLGMAGGPKAGDSASSAEPASPESRAGPPGARPRGTGKAAPAPAGPSAADFLQWQQLMQACYKQANNGAPVFNAAAMAQLPAHCAANLFAGQFAAQPLMYGAPFYGGLMPFAFPTTSAAPAAATPRESPKARTSPERDASDAGDEDSSGASGDRPDGTKHDGKKPRPEGSGVSQQEAAPLVGQGSLDSQHGAAALAALAAAQAQAGLPGVADFWRQRAGQLAGSGLDLQQLVARQPVMIKDERELKRQRRKQSNRESARRSRLRKQAECEGLAGKCEALEADNARLRATVSALQAQVAALSAAGPAVANAATGAAKDAVPVA